MRPLLIALLALLTLPALASDLSTDPWSVKPLLPGQHAPSFSAPDAAGGEFEFDAENLQKPAVLVFYRGGWCPFCNLHFAELRKAQQPLLDMGYSITFISMDSAELMAEAHLDGEPVPYALVSDAEATISRAFGIAFRVDDETYNRYKNQHNMDLEEKAGGNTHHILPAPSVFIVDTDGIIKFSYTNPDYKVRLHPEVLVAAARHMPGYSMSRK